MKGQTYTESEVQEILRRAIDRHSQQSTLNRDDLVEIAGDMGIEAAAVQSAIQDFEMDRARSRELVALKTSRRHSLLSTTITWTIVNGGMWTLSTLTEPGFWQICYWTAGLSTTALLLKAQHTLFPNSSKDLKRVEKKLQKRRAVQHAATARSEARARSSQQASPPSELLGQFDSLIEQAVTDLLRRAAQSLGLEPPKTKHKPPQNRPSSKPEPPSKSERNK